jgi:hypothetical protein
MYRMPEGNLVIGACLYQNAVPNLTILNLAADEPLTDNQVIPIVDALASNTTLQELTVYVGSRGLRVLSNAMSVNTGLKKLRAFDLRHGNFEDGQVHSISAGPLLCSIAYNSNCALEHLELASFILDDCDVSSLSFMLLRNRSLRRLDLQSCPALWFTNCAEEEVVGVLRSGQNTTLEELWLPHGYARVGCVQEWRKNNAIVQEHM